MRSLSVVVTDTCAHQGNARTENGQNEKQWRHSYESVGNRGCNFKPYMTSLRVVHAATLLSIVVWSFLSFGLHSNARIQGGDQVAVLTAERTRNSARIAAIDQEMGPIANQLQQVLQRIDAHNSQRPNPIDHSATAAFNAEADQLNQEKMDLAGKLQALKDKQDGLIARNKAIEAALTAAAPTPNEPKWTGKWNETEMEVVDRALQGFKGSELKNWIARKISFERFKRDTFGPLTANESTLRFKDDFFSSDLTDAGRENLLAFEAGKVFWNEMKDKPVEPERKTLERWFNSYGHSSVTEAMQAAAHNGETLSGLGDLDVASQFGYIFRAKAIEVDKSSDAIERQKWDAVIHDFDTHVGPLLEGDQQLHQ